MKQLACKKTVSERIHGTPKKRGLGFVFLLCLCMHLVLFSGNGAWGMEKPNIVFIFADDLGIDRNTLVVFSSDNGPEATRGKEHKFHNNSKRGLGGYYSVGETGGLKGRKRSLYAGGVRMPFIVRWPGVVPQGKIDTTSVLTAVDLLPTLLETAGVTLPDGYVPDGQSALSAFKGRELKRTKPIYWEWKGGISKDYTWPSLGIRDGRWKLLVNKDLQKMELYDMENDWAEIKEVSADYPDIVQALSAKLDAWKKTLPLVPSKDCVSKAGK